MNARQLLNFVEATLRASHGDDAVEEWLHPPTRAEKLARRAEELTALGIPFEVA